MGRKGTYVHGPDPLPGGEGGDLHTAVLGQVVDQALVEDVAVELEHGVVAKAGVKDVGGVFISPGHVHRFVGDPLVDIPDPGLFPLHTEVE